MTNYTTYDPYSAWRLACLQVRLALLPPAAFEAYLARSVLIDYCQGTLRASAPSPYARAWLQERLAGILERHLRSLMGRIVRVEFIFLAPSNRDIWDFQI